MPGKSSDPCHLYLIDDDDKDDDEYNCKYFYGLLVSLSLELSRGTTEISLTMSYNVKLERKIGYNVHCCNYTNGIFIHLFLMLLES